MASRIDLARGGAVVAWLAVALVTSGCPHASGSADPGAGFQMPPAAVTVARVASASTPVYLDEIGRCVAREVVAIQPQATGPITALHFKDGADIAEGQELFTIDPRPYEAQRSLAEANLARNKAQLELAQLELERAQRLSTSNAVSRQEVDARRGAVAVAEAHVRSSEASLALARINLEYCTIRSPIAGRAGKRLVDVGNVVMANSGMHLLVIQRQDPLYVEFTVPERELASVRAAHARGSLRIRAGVPGSADEPREGAVEFLDAAVQESTGTVRLRAVLANADRRFWPGQLVNVRLVLATEEALLVPQSAPQVGQQGPYVYVVNQAAQGLTVELRPVQTGQRHGDKVAVRAGLAAGEQVVVTGQIALFPGAPARIVEEKPSK